MNNSSDMNHKYASTASQYAETSVSSFGVSEQLRADFDMLRDVTFNAHESSSFVPKFTSKSVDLLGQQLVCRNYSNSCYELMHLCWAILHTSSDVNIHHEHAILDYFWLQQVSNKNTFAKYFVGCELQNSAIDKASIVFIDGFLRISIHQHEFAISANRANYLSCLMEWLVGVSKDLIASLNQQLLGNGANAISEAASQMQKTVYQYLSKHLIPAKLQNRYRLLQGFYSQQDEQTRCSNEGVLAFWQQHYMLEGHTKYSGVLLESLAFLDALEGVRTGQLIRFSEDINNDDKPQEDLDSNVRSLYEYNASNDNLHSALIDLNNNPKAFNKAQVELTEIIALHPLHFPNFCQSWLRAQVFGKWQNRLIQAVRDKSSSEVINNTSIYLSSKNEQQEDFNNVKEALLQILATGHQALMAIVAIELDTHPAQAMLILQNISQYVPSLKNRHTQLNELIEDNTEISSATISQWRISNAWFNEMIDKCKKSLKQINRKGFTQLTRLECSDYVLAVEQILNINNKLNQVLTTIVKRDLSKSENFIADRLIFMDVFSKLYFSADIENSQSKIEDDK